VADDVLPHLGARDLLFDVDLLSAARERGWRVVEIPTVWIDQEGSRVSALADSRRMGASLLRLWARRRLPSPRRPGWRVETVWARSPRRGHRDEEGRHDART